MTPRRSPARLHRKGTGGPAAPAPQPEPIAETRIEWAHRLDPAAPIWADIHPDDRAETMPCRSEGRCEHPRIGGHPAVHVRRTVIVTEWTTP